jgi:hypothetical protein
MNGLKSRVFVIGCILVAVCSPAWATNLPFGKVEKGTISEPAQRNRYTLSANKNDVIDFTMTVTSGALEPEICLYPPKSGTPLGCYYNSNPVVGGCDPGSTIGPLVPLPVTGTYTVLVSDCPGTNTGDYDIYTQRTNNPSDPRPLPFGQTEAGTIGLEAQSNTYTFSGNKKDVIDISMTATSASLEPVICLYSPAGDSLACAYNSNPVVGGCDPGPNTGMSYTLPVTGTYTVLVGDCPATSTGTYDIYAQRTNNPVGAKELVFGDVENGTISKVAQSNTYTFVGGAKDSVDLTMVATNPSLEPIICLYNPAGGPLTCAYNSNPVVGGCDPGSTIGLDYTLPVTGTYTVLVGDCPATSTGTYNLSSECFGTCPPRAATPVLSPKAGTYNSPQSVTITDKTDGASIYYTTDGTKPTTKSTKYSGAIMVSSTETIEAIAVATGYANSAVAKATYTIQ